MFLLRKVSCFCGVPRAAKQVEQKEKCDADVFVRLEDLSQRVGHDGEVERQGYGNLPVRYAGVGCGLVMYGIHDSSDARSPGLHSPSFTLSAIAEDDPDDECADGGAGAAGFGARSYQPPPPPPPYYSAANAPGASCGGNDATAFECDYMDSEPCAFAIIPPAPLSTVLEESDSEECSAPAGSCYSAEAGCSSNGRVPPPNLVRGLSSPSCATTSLPGSYITGGSKITASGSCSRYCTTPNRSSEEATAVTATVTAQGHEAVDPMAVWYF